MTEDELPVTRVGSGNPNARLTAEQVRQIRWLRSLGRFSYRALAERFCIGETAIFNICRGQSWTDTDGPIEGKSKIVNLRPLMKRFWSKVKKATGCWEWQGKRSGGYGYISHNGKLMRANRVAWELLRGPIPEGMHVLHDCDNPPCVRPDHLHLGTHSDNMREAYERGLLSQKGRP